MGEGGHEIIGWLAAESSFVVADSCQGDRDNLGEALQSKLVKCARQREARPIEGVHATHHRNRSCPLPDLLAQHQRSLQQPPAECVQTVRMVE